MGLFSRKKKEEKPVNAAAVSSENVKPQVRDDEVAAALPKKATFFNAVRTDAYTNTNMFGAMVSFWVALQVNEETDKWRVMCYTIAGRGNQQGDNFSAEVIKDRATSQPREFSFVDAVKYISEQEFSSSKMHVLHSLVDMESNYPEKDYPELKTYYYSIRHYKPAANIEGIAFDEYNQPHRRVDGRVISTGKFSRDEINKSILAVEQAREDELVRTKIEEGILSDIFNTVSDRSSGLDKILKVGDVLPLMDSFVLQVGAIYLSVLKIVEQQGNLDKVPGLTPDEKNVISKQMGRLAQGDIESILDETIPKMYDITARAKQIGVYVEPFEKFTAECELYLNLLNASRQLPKLEGSYTSATDPTSAGLITDIRRSVDRAREKFLELGGTEDKMDVLKAWIANRKKDPVPAWLPGFVNRYYGKRAEIMKKLKERQAKPADVNVLPADIKPPLNDTGATPSAASAAPTP